MRTVYITKYALTDGIIQRDDAIESGGDGKYVTQASGPYYDYRERFFERLGRNAFFNLDDAKRDAEKKRVRKIASLKKQIARLESLKFDTVKNMTPK